MYKIYNKSTLKSIYDVMQFNMQHVKIGLVVYMITKTSINKSKSNEKIKNFNYL